MKQKIPTTPVDYDRTRIVERPDGFYWRERGSTREAGPFATLLAAIEDMQARDDSGLEPGETLAEAESEIGIADWTDPETGDPAEESRPHIEDR
ncbi:MAG: hypothetical protein ACREUO_01595 [Burkholderiales bacterium]